MTQEVFDAAASTKAVTENIHASATPPTELTPTEQALFYYLSQQAKGRLEQEFIDRDRVVQAVREWAAVAK